MKKISALILLFCLTSNAFASYVQAPFPTAKGGTGSTSQTASKAVTTDGSGNLVSSSATTSTEIGYVNGVTSAIQTQLNGKASLALDNLAATAANISILPGVTNTIDLGSAAKAWRFIYASVLDDISGNASIDLNNRRLTASDGSTIVADYNTNTDFKVHGGVNFDLLGATSGTFSQIAAAVTTDYTITWPSAQGGAGTTLQNDGAGNLTWVPPGSLTVTNGGNAPYTIVAGDSVVRSGTTLTANRAYTLPACTGGNIGELHKVKNLPAQTFNITVTRAGADTIDGVANYVLLPGDAVELVCGANTAWDIL